MRLMAREMAAIMTAVVMAGRTGGAYAAHLATMQGNEEIDALKAFGIPVFDFLILPRIIALISMMPLLYLYGCAIGILGGYVVSITTLDLTSTGFLQRAAPCDCWEAIRDRLGQERLIRCAYCARWHAISGCALAAVRRTWAMRRQQRLWSALSAS